MAVTHGFFNSQNGDRIYSADQISSLFDGLIADGVFATVGDAFAVSAATGMNVSVGTGRAWFHKSWLLNDSAISLTIATAHVTLNRIDAIILEFDKSDGVRANTIKVVTGTPASSPVEPTLEDETATLIQVPIAYIYVGAGVTSIVGGNITYNVGEADCPMVTGVIDTISSANLTAQWDAEFNAWFDAMKDQLTTDAAGNLQTQINAIPKYGILEHQVFN